jgi:Transposase DDE domain
MQCLPIFSTEWSALVALLSQALDLNQTARAFKALVRRRGVTDAASLLRLGLGYGPCGLSLRQAAVWAEATGFAKLSNTSLLDRLRNARPWFAEIVRALLSMRVKVGASSFAGRTIHLVDGSTLSKPGSTGVDWRLHAIYDLATCCFSYFGVTDKHTAESLSHGPTTPGEIKVADRGYARPKQLQAVVNAGADFIVRIGWASLRLLNSEGTPFDLFKKLSEIPAGSNPNCPVDIPVKIVYSKRRPPLSARLIILAKPPESTEQAQKRVRRRASKNQQKTDPRTMIAAGYIMIITSLAADAFPAKEIADIYRLRWQIELAFKRLKSLLHIDDLRAFDHDLSLSWIYCHLIAALLIDKTTQEILEFSPSGPGI